MKNMKTIKVVAALIRKGNQVFATARGYGDYKGGWEFPGGKVQEGESPQEALVREIKEELDTEISVGMLFDTVEYDYPDFHLSMDCFWCSIIDGELTLKEAEDARWLSREELDEVNWLPADQKLIDRMKEEGFAIKNLVFDVGDVMLEYRWLDMLLDHGLDRKTALFVGRKMFSTTFWTDKFDRGVWSLERVLQEYDKVMPDESKYVHWFMENAIQMRGRDRTEVWDQVHRLKEEGYGIYLLSNYSKYLFDLHTAGLPFMDDIDGMVVSYEPKFVKPEPEIYYYLRDKYHLKLEECLFFDDRLANVQASHVYGMDAVQVTGREMLANVLKHL